MHLGPVDRKAKHAADEHDSDRTAKTPPESKTKNPQGKQATVSLGEFVKAGVDYVRRQKEPSILNMRFTNFQQHVSHWTLLMLTAASSYRRSE